MDPLLLYHSASLKLSSAYRPEVYAKYLNALSVVILDVCDAQRALNGGLCGLDVVVSRVRRRGGRWLDERGEECIREDISRAVEAMRRALDTSAGRVDGSQASLGHSSVGILAINGTEYVSTVDFALDDDCMELLKLFEKAREGITRREAMDDLRWSEERVVDGLEKLMRDGVVWVDLPPEAVPMLYWCPSMTLRA